MESRSRVIWQHLGVTMGTSLSEATVQTPFVAVTQLWPQLLRAGDRTGMPQVSFLSQTGSARPSKGFTAKAS